MILRQYVSACKVNRIPFLAGKRDITRLYQFNEPLLAGCPDHDLHVCRMPQKPGFSDPCFCRPVSFCKLFKFFIEFRISWFVDKRAILPARSSSATRCFPIRRIRTRPAAFVRPGSGRSSAAHAGFPVKEMCFGDAGDQIIDNSPAVFVQCNTDHLRTMPKDQAYVLACFLS